MHMTFLYGPPATGKHTIGQALSNLTGDAFFYNQLTVDAVKPLFPIENAAQGELKTIMRVSAAEMAAREGVSFVFTLAYSGAVDDVQVQQYVDVVEKHGGTVDFVQLCTPVDELMARVENESRKTLKKLSDKSRLEARLEKRDHFAAVKHERNLKVNTTEFTPEEAAKHIAKHYGYTTRGVSVSVHPVDGQLSVMPYQLAATHLSIREWQERTGQNEFSDILDSQHDLLRVHDYYVAGGGQFFVATSGDELLGFVGVRKDGPGVYSMKRLAVVPEWHRKGVAKQLVADALEWTRSKDAEKVTLLTNKRENARPLYESFGFEVIGFIESSQDWSMSLTLNFPQKL